MQIILSLFKKIRSSGIAWSLFLVIVLITVNFSLFFYSHSVLIKSQEVKDQVHRLMGKFDALWDDTHTGDLGIRGYMMIPTEKMLSPFTGSFQGYEANFDTINMILTEQGFDVRGLKELKNRYEEKINELHEIKRLVDAGRQDEAIAILEEDNGYELWLAYDELLKRVTAFEETLNEEAEIAYRNTLRNTFFVQVFLALISIPSLLAIYFRLRNNARQRNNLIQQLKQSHREYLFAGDDAGLENKELDEKQIIYQMVEDLKKSAAFIQHIGKGNYEVKWEGMNETNRKLNQDNLAGELLNMREQMKRVKEEEEKRSWTNEGLAKFGDLISRRDEDLDLTLERFLAELVKYLDANQGGVFVLDELEGDPTLELKACYAYGRKKFETRTLQPGQGLVGQAFIEKDVINLTEIPDDYIRITSGLGEAPPRNILIAPMFHNEEVVGVLELASFKKFRKHEVDFVCKVLENLAASLVSVNMNAKTKKLLEESQIQARQLQSQEEELRQNAEELQAQHETLNGQNEELKRRIQELESQFGVSENA